ncbi:hypothetical protein DFQ28_001081 [Apophysomyces sp. BC1034]|nr:hypothetical protein DFQ30_001721 [Apophysomyces sp. BC1015]KAG0183744.1 hypothetical protein DFQ28_001081 [Apophysomyces sp. BC1034]
MSLPPAFYDAFEPYFNSTSSPTLETFIEEYGQTIATYHKRGEDLSAVWTSRYSKSWNYFYRNTPEKQPPKIRSKDINWGDVALLILKMENTGNEDAGVSAAVSNVAKSDNSSHSTTTTPTLTTEFLDEFRATHACMDITKKWVLKSGTVVEDKMFSYGLKCKYENAAHSFILDLGDAVWSEVFNEEELEELRTYKVKKLPEVNGELLDYLNSYTNITNLDDLISHARSQTFNFDKQFDLDWVQDTIYTALRLFKAKYIPLSDQTEADIIRRVWYFVDTAYDDLPIDVRSGEMESTASSARRNMKRAYPSRKMHGHQADFLLKLSTSELACAEVGKKDGGATGSKELREAGLKCPKMMKDMMGNLIATYPHANDLVTVGYIIMETTNEYTAAQKRLTYKQQDSAHKAIAFKIDFRLFHHCCHSGKRIDIAKVESAKPGSNDKVTLDHAKLLREGKDALDRLLQAVMEQCVAYAMKAFVIQLDGFQGQMSSIHLDQLLYLNPKLEQPIDRVTSTVIGPK